jgi:adenylyltransferase/sulfurtransferase
VTASPATIAIVGAGGLGGPIAFACSAAGAPLVVCDPDRVELSNLQRQVQFGTADVGAAKAATLAAAIAARGGAPVRAVEDRFAAATADAIAADAAVIVDGSDDPATKFFVADWAVARGKPYVIAAAIQHHGSVMVGVPGAACYRCLFEEPPADAPTCGDAGVLGATVGAVGGLAAAFALALASGATAPESAIHVFDDLRTDLSPRAVFFTRRAGCPTCARSR